MCVRACVRAINMCVAEFFRWEPNKTIYHESAKAGIRRRQNLNPEEDLLLTYNILGKKTCLYIYII